MSIKAVIFDVGGVLLRSESESGRRKWEQQLGLAEGELAGLIFDSPVSQMATVGRADDEAIWESLAARFALDGEQLHQLRRDFWSGDRLDSELARYLGSLRPRRKTALLSNAWPRARKALMERMGLGEVVDAMIISSEEGVAKPDPTIYQIALHRLGVQPHEAVFVDDMPANVEAACLLGIAGVRFRTREQTIADIERILASDEG